MLTFDKLEHIRNRIHVERFCCCAELRTGCYIIAGLEWIFIILRVYLIVEKTKLSQSSAVSYYDIEYKVCYIAISLVISVALIWGAYKYKRYFLIPWLIIKCFEGILMVIVTFIFFVMVFFTDDYLFLAIITFIAFFIGSGLSWYLWVCVWNFYEILNDTRTNVVSPEVMMEGIDKESHMAYLLFFILYIFVLIFIVQ